MQSDMNYRSLMNEKQALVKEFEKSIQEKEKLIQRLESEKQQIQDELNRMKAQSKVKVQTPIQSTGSGDPKVGHVSQGSQNQVMSSAVEQLKNVNVNGVSFNMVYCPAGEFWMGTDDASLTADYWKRSKPKHKVKMNKGFWMGETQVTQELWKKVRGGNPSCFKGSTKLPIENVTWYDCLEFCNNLSKLEGLTPCFNLTNGGKNVEWLRNANGYRLPTEAEWEYSAKAGTELIYSGSNRIDEVAWYEGNFSNKTHEVKGKKANAWGLYDMSGNVWEWCMDKWDENVYQSRSNGIENPILWDNSSCARVLRGGSCWNFAVFCRVADRSWDDADHRSSNWGLRLLRCEP
jgi:formylglycine-generating enzyme required for sulfatase activity